MAGDPGTPVIQARGQATGYCLMPVLASLNDARDYFEQLPAQLEVYFDEAYQRAFDRLISAFEQFFDIAETVNQQADDDHDDHDFDQRKAALPRAAGPG